MTRKIAPNVLLVLVAAALACADDQSSTAPTLPTNVAAQKVNAADRVLAVGHRGASGHAPEHTIASYDLALELGADYIEQDLQLTSDGVLVVLHDPTLNRTARGAAENCTGLVIEKTLAQIKTCDVGTWFNEANQQEAKPEYVGATIPTLEEVFERYRHRANYYIETKNPEDAPLMEEKLLQLLDKFNLRDMAVQRNQVLIQSFSAASLQKIHALDPALPLIQLYGGGSSATIRATFDQVKVYAVGVGPSSGSVDAAFVEAAHARCLDIHPYTVNSQSQMSALIALGVDGMFTNFPDRLNELLGRTQAPAKLGAKNAADAHRECLANLSGLGE